MWSWIGYSLRKSFGSLICDRHSVCACARACAGWVGRRGGSQGGGQENCIPKPCLPWAGSWRQVAARGCLRMLLLHTCVNVQVREQLWVCLGI